MRGARPTSEKLWSNAALRWNLLRETYYHVAEDILSLLSIHLTMAEAPICKVVLAGNVAKKLLAEVQEGLREINRAPLLVGFLASGDPAARTYAEWTGKTAREK